jgi:hypothetical protein
MLNLSILILSFNGLIRFANPPILFVFTA